MIKWCSYCQKFQGESAPFDNYAVSHGICADCESKGIEKLDAELESTMRLVSINHDLMIAGSKQDMQLAHETILRARREGIQDVDLLMGVIAPILWEIGNLWAAGKITVADEHRFTAFYNDIISTMEKNDRCVEESKNSDAIDILITNAPYNVHYLGSHCLNLWLHSKKIKSVLGESSHSLESLLTQIKNSKPKNLGFSVALSEQIPTTLGLCEEIRKELGANTPRLILGGNAIKGHAQEAREGITFVHDLNALMDLLKDDRKVP
jgi:methanogenic corrinoid protein MtbC1